MKRYADGGKLPAAEEAAKTAVLEPAGKPMTRAERMDKLVIDKETKLNPKNYPMPMEPIKKAKGGTASSRADGIAKRGKTRGTIVMCKGGMYK